MLNRRPSAPPPMRRAAARQVALIVCTALFAGLAARCTESPQEVYQAAWQAKEAKDFDRYVGYFTDRSQVLLKNLYAKAKHGTDLFAYLDDPFDAVPSPEVKEVKETKNLCLITVGDKKEPEQVVLLREEAGWRIDVVESDRFFHPITVRAAGEEPLQKGP